MKAAKILCSITVGLLCQQSLHQMRSKDGQRMLIKTGAVDLLPMLIIMLGNVFLNVTWFALCQ